MKRRPAHLRLQQTECAKDEKRRKFVHIFIEEIEVGLLPRHIEQDAPMTALAASIAKHGLLQPIVVRRDEVTGRYVLICGARRLFASRMLGCKEIDALLIHADEAQAAACFFEEHETHTKPHFLDDVQLLTRTGVEQVKAQYALMPSYLLLLMQMTKLSADVRRVIREMSLTIWQAQPLLHVRNPERQIEAAWIIAQRALTPKQANRLVLGPPKMNDTDAASGRRRIIRSAVKEITLVTDRLRAQGIEAGVSVNWRSGGLCIQIELR